MELSEHETTIYEHIEHHRKMIRSHQLMIQQLYALLPEPEVVNNSEEMVIFNPMRGVRETFRPQRG